MFTICIVFFREVILYEYTCAYENILTWKWYQNANKQTKDTILKLLPGLTQCQPPKISHFPFRYSCHLWDRGAESWSHPETLCQPPGNMLPLPLRVCSLIFASADRKIASQKPRQDSDKPGVHNTCLLWNQHKPLSCPLSPAKHSPYLESLRVGVRRWETGSLFLQILLRGQVPSSPIQRFLSTIALGFIYLD